MFAFGSFFVIKVVFELVVVGDEVCQYYFFPTFAKARSPGSLTKMQSCRARAPASNIRSP